MMVEERGYERFLEGVDFAGTTIIKATLMAAPYVLFLALIFGTIDLLIDRVMPVRGGQ